MEIAPTPDPGDGPAPARRGPGPDRAQRVHGGPVARRRRPVPELRRRPRPRARRRRPRARSQRGIRLRGARRGGLAQRPFAPLGAVPCHRRSPGRPDGLSAASLVMPDGSRIVLGAETVDIGRLPECGIVLNDPNVSRRHAEVRRRGSDVVVVDLGSTNGTRVNGVPDPRAGPPGRGRGGRGDHHHPLRNVIEIWPCFLTSLDNQNLLRALEMLVVALIWLFFLRVIRAVWVEVRPPSARGAVAQVAAGTGRSAERRSRVGAPAPPGPRASRARRGRPSSSARRSRWGAPRAAGCASRTPTPRASTPVSSAERLIVGGGPRVDERDMGQRRAHRQGRQAGQRRPPPGGRDGVRGGAVTGLGEVEASGGR